MSIIKARQTNGHTCFECFDDPSICLVKISICHILCDMAIPIFFALNVVVLREETMELKSSCLGMSTPWRLDLAAASNIFLAVAASAVTLVILMIC